MMAQGRRSDVVFYRLWRDVRVLDIKFDATAPIPVTYRDAYKAARNAVELMRQVLDHDARTCEQDALISVIDLHNAGGPEKVKLTYLPRILADLMDEKLLVEVERNRLYCVITGAPADA
jgi:hypothetical protein